MVAGDKPSELKEDSYLILGGEDTLIHVISIKRTKTISVLEGHKDSIVALSCTPKYPDLLLSASKDSTVRLWKLHESVPLVQKLDTSATVVVCMYPMTYS
jgi:WD40 repeat protein